MWDIPNDYFNHNIFGQKSVNEKQHLHFLSLLEAQCKIVDKDLNALGQKDKSHIAVILTPNNKLIGCVFHEDEPTSDGGNTYKDILTYTLDSNEQLKQLGIIKYTLCKDNVAYIDRVYTSLGALRQGVAYATMVLALNDMQKRGIKKVYLDSAKFKPAFDLYKKFNFKITDAGKNDSPLYIDDEDFQPMSRAILEEENIECKIKAKNVLMPPKVQGYLLLDISNPAIEKAIKYESKCRVIDNRAFEDYVK